MRRWGGPRAPPRPGASQRRATGGRRAAATPHVGPPSRGARAAGGAEAAAPPRPAARQRGTTAGRPPASLPAAHPREHALVLGARQGRQAKPAKTGLVLEEERQPQRVVRPADAAHAGARHVRAEVEHVVGVTQRDEHLSTVGEPARIPRLLVALVRYLNAPEIPVQRLVLRRERDRVGGLVEPPPDRGPILHGRLAEAVHP